MTDEELVRRISAAASSGDSMEIDNLCYKRLESLCRDFGEEGVVAQKLLTIVGEQLELYS